MGYSSGKDSDYSYSSRASRSSKDSDYGSSSSKDSDYRTSSGKDSCSSKDSDSSSSVMYSSSFYSSNNGYTPTKPSSKLALQLIKAMEEKQELEEKRTRNEAEIAKVDKKIQELVLKLKDDPNFSDIVGRFNGLVLRR